MGDWVVTPRRGKAVEINALWYNALELLARWCREEGMPGGAENYGDAAKRARDSFNQRFWLADGGYLFDVVDCNGQSGTTDHFLPAKSDLRDLDSNIRCSSKHVLVIRGRSRRRRKIGYRGGVTLAFA